MKAEPYQILGDPVPSMMGRTELLDLLEQRLLKETPDHVMVIGPKWYGKSVLLRHLANAHCENSRHYLTTALIDFQHNTPNSNETFMQRFGEEVKTALKPVDEELSDYLGIEGDILFAELQYVLEELAKRNRRMLVVLDSLDYVPFGAQITLAPLENLRSLGTLKNKPLTLVTGSRRPPREICRAAAVSASPFWNVFLTEPMKVAALVESDWPSFLEPLKTAGHTLDESAEREIINWTGGVPVLVCALLRKLLDQGAKRSLSEKEIDQAARELLKELPETLKRLWDDCSPDLRTDLDALARGIDIKSADLSHARRDAIMDRGFGQITKRGKGLGASCKLIQHYAKGQAPVRTDLGRLFGNPDDFETNIRSLLELRLNQIASLSVASNLFKYVGNAVQQIDPDQPEDALAWLQRIVECALDLIWESELMADKKLPPEWVEEWESAYVNFQAPGGKLPKTLGQQLNILRLATGTASTKRRTRCVTKKTYLSIDHLKSVRDIVDHSSEYPEIKKVSMSFVVAIILDAISLLENLADELS